MHQLAEKLNSHMTELASVAEGIKEADKKAVEPTADPTSDPMWSEEYTFDFEYKSANGKVYRWEKLTSVIPTIRQQRRMSIARASLANGVPYESLDIEGREAILLLTRIEFGLKEGSLRPEWAKDLEDVRDIQVLREIYDKFRDHEVKFFRDGEAS